MPRPTVSDKDRKQRITVSLNPRNKAYIERKSKKRDTSVSAEVNDLITQDRKKS
jgi:hypothetical protein